MKHLHSARNQRLRQRLRAIRESAGVTQVEMAQRLGKPQSYVSKYESGERRLDVLEFADVCDALGASPATVLRDALSVTEDPPTLVAPDPSKSKAR